MTAISRHLRPRDGGAQPTTAVELLFDLVYVFAVTQLSHLVIDSNLSLVSLGRAGLSAAGRVVGVDLHDLDGELV